MQKSLLSLLPSSCPPIHILNNPLLLLPSPHTYLFPSFPRRSSFHSFPRPILHSPSAPLTFSTSPSPPLLPVFFSPFYSLSLSLISPLSISPSWYTSLPHFFYSQNLSFSFYNSVLFLSHLAYFPFFIFLSPSVSLLSASGFHFNYYNLPPSLYPFTSA